MSLRHLASLAERPAAHSREAGTAPRPGHGPIGHPHFWERTLGRRRFLHGAAGAAGLALAAGLLAPARAWAQPAAATGRAPRPIPGGIRPFGPDSELIHVFDYSPGFEPSTITDFDGVVGIAHFTGMGTAWDAKGARELPYDSDMRFMVGRYVAMDGRTYEGTFGFI
jgi:hypothetical protein